MEQILALIEANQGITGQELADACDVPWSLMQKDLETISLDIDHPIPLYTDEDNSGDNLTDVITPQRRWFIETSNKRNAPVHLTVGESLQILDALSFIKQEPSKQNSLKQKISTSLDLENEGTYRCIKGSLAPVKQIDDQILMTIEQAINHRRKISFEFKSHMVVAVPLGLIYYSRLRQWYLAASLDEIVKTYSLAKIQKVRERSEPFVYPDHFSLRDWLAPRWGMEFGEPTRVKVRFANRSQTIAKVCKDVAHRPCRLTEENGGQSLLYEDTVIGKNEFMAWVLGFGSAAEVLEPRDIREEIMTRVKNTLARYK
jgi:predicted DNA-binding transcriptional regulator YafY